jgi:hypothetical protein
VLSFGIDWVAPGWHYGDRRWRHGGEVVASEWSGGGGHAWSSPGMITLISRPKKERKDLLVLIKVKLMSRTYLTIAIRPQQSGR